MSILLTNNQSTIVSYDNNDRKILTTQDFLILHNYIFLTLAFIFKVKTISNDYVRIVDSEWGRGGGGCAWLLITVQFTDGY